MSYIEKVIDRVAQRRGRCMSEAEKVKKRCGRKRKLIENNLSIEERHRLLSTVAGSVHLAALKAMRLLRNIDPGIELDDVISECWLGAMKASRLWDPNGAACFNTYATWWLRSAISEVIRKTRRFGFKTTPELGPEVYQLRITKLNSSRCSVREGCGSDEWFSTDIGEPPKEFGEQWDAKDWQWLLRCHIPKTARRFIKLHFCEAVSYKEIGRRNGITHEAVRQQIERALVKLRERALRGELVPQAMLAAA